MLRLLAASATRARPSARRLCSAPAGGSGSVLGRLTEKVSEAVLPTQNRARKKAVDKMTAGLEGKKGWRAALEDGLATQQAAKRDEFVTERMQELARMDTYGFEDLADELQRGLEEMENQGLVQRARLYADKLSGGEQSDNIEKLKELAKTKLAIIGELNEHERLKPKIVCRLARADIAQKLGLPVRLVERLLFEFEVNKAQWTFLRREYLRGRPLPSNSSEFEWMVQRRPTREFVHVMMTMRKQREKRAEKQREAAKEQKKDRRRTRKEQRRQLRHAPAAPALQADPGGADAESAQHS